MIGAGKSSRCFGFRHIYPDKVLSVTGDRMVAAGRLGGRGICSFLGMGIGREDLRNAELLESRLESMQWAQDSSAPWESRVAKAKAAAIGIARAEGMTKNIGAISYIAAHCAAGYGPVSMLLSDYKVDRVEIPSEGKSAAVHHALFGECDTNVRFLNERALAEAVSAMERDAYAGQGGLVVDVSVDGSKVSVARVAMKRMEVADFINEGFVSKEVLAYIWMALEAGMNIIVTGNDAGIRKALKMAPVLLGCRQRVMAAANGDASAWLGHANITMCSAMGWKAGADADRIVIEKLSVKEVSSAFRCAMLGRPILAGIPGLEDLAPAKALLPLTHTVDDALLSKLDVSVHVPTSQCIEKITEYRWFSNGEAEEGECGAPSEPSRLEMASNGELNAGALVASKAMYWYSKRYAIRAAKAAEELAKRAAFLASCATPTIDGYLTLQKLK